MSLIRNSDRHLLKATHTAVEFDQASGTPPSRAHEKAAMVRGLQLRQGEVSTVRAVLANQPGPPIPDSTWSVLAAFEPQPVGILVPKASTLADVPIENLASFGQAVVSKRRADLATAAPGEPGPPGPTGQPREPGPPGPTGQVPQNVPGFAPQLARASEATITAIARTQAAAMPSTAQPPVALQQVAAASNLVTAAQGAVDAFTSAVKITPIGMLHLERVEMSPAGIERGELLATIPLAPMESTSVVQHEWSVTNQELSSIVTDYLESYSEKGVTEKTELAEASSSETKHDQQMGLDASLSGSYGFVTFSTNAKFQDNLSTDQSQKDSRNNTKEVTTKAASRVRKERKVTIQTSTTTGQSETTTRTLSNPSATDSMRIDYYSMMRKWEVRLLQYGLRLTYDIAIPEPGSALRQQLAELDTLQQKVSKYFVFNVPQSDINEVSYLQYAATYQAQVPSPPPAVSTQVVGGPVTGLTGDDGDKNWRINTVNFNVPSGYAVQDVSVDYIEDNPFMGSNTDFQTTFMVVGLPAALDLQRNQNGSLDQDSAHRDLTAEFGFMQGLTDHQEIIFVVAYCHNAAANFTITSALTQAGREQWQSQVWGALYNAAQAAYYSEQQAVNAQIAAITDQLNAADTLTLRQEELAEVMKGVLRWLLGPDFEFMPQSVIDLFTGSGLDLAHGLLYASGNTLGVDSSGWMTMFQYQEMVKFLHEAIEWENLIYFLYPYFWDIPASWDFVRRIQHPDPTRQQFLRAGSARVVLTVRPGFEDSFAAFVDRGDFGDVLPPDHPYVSIGQQIAAYSNTNYPGVPPANPEQDYRPLLTPLQRQAWREIQSIIAVLTQYQGAHGAYPTTSEGLAALAGLGSLPAADPWGNPYIYQCPGAYADYDLSSNGADGLPGGEGSNADITTWATASLIGMWYEYTPSHGTDIQVNTAPADMA